MSVETESSIASRAAQTPLLLLPAVEDNAAMNKPFQFSMRWLFYGRAWFCVGAWSLSVLVKNGPRDYPLMPLVLYTVVGGTIGAIGGKTMVGALAGAVLAIAIYSAMPVVY
jgi:hypothetical protein